MLRRFWDSREGGLAKAVAVIGIVLILLGFLLVGAAVTMDVIAEAVR